MIALLVILAAILIAIVGDFFREARRAAMRGKRQLAVVYAGFAWVVIAGVVPMPLYFLSPSADVGWFGFTLTAGVGYLHVRHIGRTADAAGGAQ